MEGERARIQRLLETGKINEEEARKLSAALERRPAKQRPGGRKKLLGGLVIAVFAAAAAVAFLLVSMENRGEIENLLVNAGLETGAGGMPSGWTPSVSGAAFLGSAKEKNVFLWDSKVKRSGVFSMAINTAERSDKKTLSWMQDITTFPKDRKLLLTGYIKTASVSADGGATLQIRGYRGLKEQTFLATTGMSYDMTGTKEWTRVQVQAQVKEGTEKVRILCNLDGSGTMWCDDLELRVIE